MKKQLLSMLLLLLVVFTVLPTMSQAAHANGTYDVPYQVNKPSSADASIANDYFVKPAKVTVNNGSYTVQLTIKNSSWVSEFNPPGGSSVVASNPDADTRTVRFSTSSVERVTIAMKIDIDDIDYHHAYSVDFLFNTSSIPATEATTSSSNTSSAITNNQSTSTNGSSNVATNQAEGSSETVIQEINPQTSDSLPYSLFLLLIVSAFFMMRTKKKY